MLNAEGVDKSPVGAHGVRQDRLPVLSFMIFSSQHKLSGS